MTLKPLKDRIVAVVEKPLEKTKSGILLGEAKDMGLVTIDLKSTEEGYSLYRSVGFRDDHSKYHMMKWNNQELA